MSYTKDDIRLESRPIKPEMLTVRVTQSDIENGHAESETSCPIALAIKRQSGIKVWVDSARNIDIGFGKYRALEPEVVQRFIDSFENFQEVCAFEFEVEEVLD